MNERKRQGRITRSRSKRGVLGAAFAFTTLTVLAAASACGGSDEDGEPDGAGKGGVAGKGSGGSATGGSATGGSATGGSATGGSATGGSATGGSATGGSATGGKGGGSSGGSSGDGAMGGSDAGSGGSDGASGGKGGGGSGGSAGSGTGTSTAAELAEKLGRKKNFLIGMGNDLNEQYDHTKDGAYLLGPTLDIHYAYLVGLPGKGGWPDWNAEGSFVNILTDTADANGVTPMFDLYAMAASGENNQTAVSDPAYMGPYWQGVKLMFQRLAIFDKPAIVHLEPDFWGFFQQNSGGDPTAMAVKIHGLATDCEDLPEDLSGLGQCIVRLSRMYAPKVAVGFHASRWAGDPNSIVTFLTAIGGADADFIGIDMLDRDAGCFEAQGEGCTRQDGPWYWDESNEGSPNFHEFLAFSKTVSDGLAKPIIFWQIPFGVPSETPGGTPGHYRDNRVHYIFNHIDEFVDAGAVGAVFGVGAGGQTYPGTDGDQFKNAVTAYLANPTPLP